MKSKDNYNKFLYKIQQHKMKEFWDNKNDEIWEKLIKKSDSSKFK
ncbi:MAG: hypothetical protein AABX19_00115 [Nanoarchaeota archaeon]